MKYILYCHSGSANHGCEALVRTIASLLQPAEVVVLSDAPEEDVYYKVNEVAKPFAGSAKPRVADWIKAYLKLKIQHDYHYMDAISYFPALDIIEKDDIAISIGGDIYCYEHYPKYMYINREIRKRARKMILMGCSIESELLKDEKLREDLNRFDLIIARESITYESLKIIYPNVVLLPDSAFTLPCVELPLPEKWQENNMVGINISPLILQKAEKPEVVVDAFRKLIQYIIEETDMGVALVPHVVWENNDDRKPLKELYQEWKESGRVVMIEDHNCSELKGYISRCRFFIGTRTHATIAAYSTGVPTLVVGYSVKARGIAKDLFGVEQGYVLPVQEIKKREDVVKAFQSIMKQEIKLKQILTEKQKNIGSLQDYVEQMIKENR